MTEIKALTKFCISHRRTDDPTKGLWAAYLWAENYMGAWEKAKDLEEQVTMIYDISIEGVFLGELDAGIEINQSESTSSLKSIVPWFIFYQLDEYEETEPNAPDYDAMIKYFELIEAFEICAKLVTRKNSKKNIKI